MAKTKKVSTRIQNKHDLEVNWITADKNGFVPLIGEIIVYDTEIDANGNTLALPDKRTIPYTYERFKVGDGIKTVQNLPFVTDVAESKVSAVESSLEDLDEFVKNNHLERTYEYLNTRGWYRIAETPLNVYSYNNLIQLTATRNGISNSSIFAASGAFSATPKIIHVISSKYNGLNVDSIRVVYPKDYTNQKAYLDIHIASATVEQPVRVKLSSITNIGWNFYTKDKVNMYGDYIDPDGPYGVVSQNLDNDIDALFRSEVEAISPEELNDILV